MIRKAMLTVAATALLSPAAYAASTEELKLELDEVKAQLKVLNNANQLKTAPESQGGAQIKQAAEKTKIGGYGELNYSFSKSGNTFDPNRIVLYVDTPLAEWIDFRTELEWEHGGVTDEVKNNGLSGEARVEQAYLDFKFSNCLKVRTGVMLVPVGALNLYHEPTSFNSTERPMLDQTLIPSTWSEMGVSIYGALGSKADYQLMVLNGLNGSGFSAAQGIRGGRQNYNEDNNRGKAVAGRLELQPLSNLYTNISFYTGNSAADGAAYTTVAAFDGKYSVNDFTLAGEYVFVYQDDPALLGATDIGQRMSGYWIEGAYNVMPTAWKRGKLAQAEAKAFVRWSEINTQQGTLVDPSQKSGRYDRNYVTAGVAFNPVTNVTIKADYQFYGDHRASGETALDGDKFQLSLGFVF